MKEGAWYPIRTLIYLILHKGVLDVHNETLNDKYLGLPSDVGRSKNYAFRALKDPIWKKLHGWMEKILSGGPGKGNSDEICSPSNIYIFNAPF
jgi:hypothetical protein